MSSNMQRLGATLADRMKKTSAAAVPTTLELGTIGSNLSLTTDSLPIPIPKGDYMITLSLTSGTNRTSSESHTHSGDDHTHDGGEHSHALPSAFRSLKAGDRVLVAWCGNEPVVVAIVVSS